MLSGARSCRWYWIHLLARSGLGNWIHLSLNLFKLDALYICLSVLSCHPRAVDTPPSPPFLIPSCVYPFLAIAYIEQVSQAVIIFIGRNKLRAYSDFGYLTKLDNWLVSGHDQPVRGESRLSNSIITKMQKGIFSLGMWFHK